MVDTRDLKSLAPMSMRVRLPPVLPTTEHREHYEKPVMIEEIVKLNDLEVFVVFRVESGFWLVLEKSSSINACYEYFRVMKYSLFYRKVVDRAVSLRACARPATPV